MSGGEVGHSVLVVPVPALEDFARAQALRYDAAWLSPDPAFPHAHVTVLGPFLPLQALDAATHERVAEVLGRHTSFGYRLEEIATFPDGTIYLRPDPVEPFAALTAALWAAFPDYPPYAGRHLDLTPHVTLDMTVTGATERSLRAQLGHGLPHGCVADAVVLSWYAAGACRTLDRWALAPA